MYTTWQGEPWILATQSANSRALGMVADRKAKRTLCGARMMDSSHTTPRSLSLQLGQHMGRDWFSRHEGVQPK